MKAHWKYILVSLIIGWFLGASCGLFGMFNHGRTGMGMRGMGHMRKKLYHELQLSPEQKSKAEAILKNSREKIDGVRKTSRDDMRKMLTPEQQAIFDAHNTKMDTRRKRWSERKHKPYE